LAFRCIGKVIEISGVSPQLFDAFDRVSHEEFELIVHVGHPNDAATPASNTGEFMVNLLVEGTGILVRQSEFLPYLVKRISRLLSHASVFLYLINGQQIRKGILTWLVFHGPTSDLIVTLVEKWVVVVLLRLGVGAGPCVCGMGISVIPQDLTCFWICLDCDDGILGFMGYHSSVGAQR
jgi:hypothetical protein